MLSIIAYSQISYLYTTMPYYKTGIEGDYKINFPFYTPRSPI